LTGRTRGAVFAAAAGFLLLCALLPLAFSGEEKPPDGPGNTDVSQTTPAVPTYTLTELDDRIRLFDTYFDGDAGSIIKTELKAGDIESTETAAQCQDVLEKLIAVLSIDEAEEYINASGTNYYTLADSRTGASIRVAEGFRDWYGDWKNWLRICIDMDTFDIYYVYLSSNCLYNFDSYAYIDAQAIAWSFGEELGLELIESKDVGPAEDGKASVEVVYYNGTEYLGSGHLAYRLHGSTYYEPSAASQLVDYTMTAIPYENQTGAEVHAGISNSAYDS